MFRDDANEPAARQRRAAIRATSQILGKIRNDHVAQASTDRMAKIRLPHKQARKIRRKRGYNAPQIWLECHHRNTNTSARIRAIGLQRQ
jgi:hypothetical protein